MDIALWGRGAEGLNGSQDCLRLLFREGSSKLKLTSALFFTKESLYLNLEEVDVTVTV